MDLSVTVQQLAEQWQEQDCRHAMLTAAKALVLQVARFCYDSEFDRATKRRYGVVLCLVDTLMFLYFATDSGSDRFSINLTLWSHM